MANKYLSALSPEREDILHAYKESCDEMGDYTTREKSLYVMLREYDTLVERLNKNGVEGTHLLWRLHYKYTQNDLTDEKPASVYTDETSSGDFWKYGKKPDIELTSMFSVQLTRQDLTLEEAIYNTFVYGANATKDITHTNSFHADQQTHKTPIIKEYLYTTKKSWTGEEEAIPRLQPLKTSENAAIADKDTLAADKKKKDPKRNIKRAIRLTGSIALGVAGSAIYTHFTGPDEADQPPPKAAIATHTADTIQNDTPKKIPALRILKP